MKTINLEEILVKTFEPSLQLCSTITQDLQLAITLNPNLNKIKEAMKETAKQALELAAENVEIEELNEPPFEEFIVDRQSILNTINQVI